MADMDEAVLKRVLPHSIEAEQSVIGAMLMDREAITIASEQIKGKGSSAGNLQSGIYP